MKYFANSLLARNTFITFKKDILSPLLMKPFFVRIYITLIATCAAILFMMLSFFFSEDSILILSIETILIPCIYIIGQEILEYITKEKYSATIDEINAHARKLNENYTKEKLLNKGLSKEIERLKKYAKKEK